MKKSILFKSILLSFLLLALNNQISAQIYCQGINLNNEKDLTYIYVTKFGTIDYGYNTIKSSAVRDKKNKKVKLNSPIQMINYFEKNGWEYKRLETFSPGNNVNIPKFLFKRKND